MPAEIDISKAVRGLHHTPPGAKLFPPASIEQSVWQYFSVKAEQKGIDLSELLADILKRDIEINEALKQSKGLAATHRAMHAASPQANPRMVSKAARISAASPLHVKVACVRADSPRNSDCGRPLCRRSLS
jgi:hypothetical protein